MLSRKVKAYQCIFCLNLLLFIADMYVTNAVAELQGVLFLYYFFKQSNIQILIKCHVISL